MSKTVVIRYQTTPDAAEDNHQAIAEVFAQLAKETPEGLRYASFQLADKVSFVHIAMVEDGFDPLPKLAAFQEFQKGLKDRLDGSPERGQATLIGSYGFLTE